MPALPRLRSLSQISLLALAMALHPSAWADDGAAAPGQGESTAGSEAAAQAAQEASVPLSITAGDWLKGVRQVIVPGFRVAFVTKGSARAHSRSAFSNIGGGSRVRQAASASIEVSLHNVDDARMQAITEQAYADFLAALAAAGLDVVPLASLKTGAGWKELEFNPAGERYEVSPSGSGKTYRFFAPEALPLWFGHFDSSLGNASPFSLGNWRALNRMSTDAGSAVVLLPQIVIDFADVESSGNSMWRTSAEVSARSAMSLAAHHTRVEMFKAERPEFGEMGRIALDQPAALPGEVGELVDVTSEDTRTATQVANTLTTVFTMFTGTQGIVRSKQESALKADPDAYQRVAGEGARHLAALLAATIVQQR